MRSDSSTQRSRILQLLDNARGEWVPLPEILDLGIAQYNSRILELRRLGFRIENRKERHDGKILSSFRLVTGSAGNDSDSLDLPTRVAPCIQESEQREPPAAPLSLFGDLTPHHRDLG